MKTIGQLLTEKLRSLNVIYHTQTSVAPPAPTPAPEIPVQVTELQERQWKIRERCYRAMCDGDETSLQTANTEYDETVVKLETLLGPQALCSQVDADLALHYSDYHKDVYGFRPKVPVTRAEVLEWIDLQNKRQFSEDDLIDPRELCLEC